MGDFNNDSRGGDRGGGNRGFSDNRRGGGGGDRGRGGGGNRGFDGPREMHKATCAECKSECEVPFKPNGEKPVYCRDCFNKR